MIKRARLIPGGSWAALAAKVQPANQDLLNGLPNGPFVMAAGATMVSGSWNSLMDFSVDVMRDMHGLYGLSEEQIKQMPRESIAAAMNQVRSMSMVLGVGPRGASLYSKFVTVMRVEDTHAFMDVYEKSFREYAQFALNVQSPILQPVEFEKREIDGVDALQFTTKAPPMPAAQPTPQYSQMMEVMFGPGGRVTGWVVPADAHTVIVTYVDESSVRSTVQAIKQGSKGLGDDEDVARTAGLLPADAASVAFWSPRGTVELINRLAPAFAPNLGDAEAVIPEFDATPPIGFAITSAANDLRGHMVIPPEVLTAIGQYIGKVQSRTAARQ